MARQLAAFFLAAALVRAASAGEARDESDDAGVDAHVGAEKAPSDTRNGRLDDAAMRAFELLLSSPADPEQALSLTESARDRGGEGDAADIKWPLAHAFALARAGESVRAAGELETLARRLRQGVGLDVRDFRFVTRVAAFGVYEEDGRQVFRPGGRLMAYAEVIGFTCRPTPEVETGPVACKVADVGSTKLSGRRGVEGVEAGWRVSLEAEFTLENRLTGEQVAAWGPESVQHATRSQISDLHVTRVIALPDDLASGEYELKVDVRDALAAGASAGGALRQAQDAAVVSSSNGGGVRRLRVAEW